MGQQLSLLLPAEAKQLKGTPSNISNVTTYWKGVRPSRPIRFKQIKAIIHDPLNTDLISFELV